MSTFGAPTPHTGAFAASQPAAAAAPPARPAGAISLDPETFTAGFFDDADGLIINARWCYFNYQGKGETALTLGVQIQDEEAKLHEQYYSAGDIEAFKPSDDGGWLIPNPEKGKTALNKNTNAAMFLASVVAAGMPKDWLTSYSVTQCLVGMKAHFKSVAQPKRPGLIKTGAQAQGDREKTTLLVSHIHQLPGGAVPAPTNVVTPTPTAAAPAPTPAPMAAPGGGFGKTPAPVPTASAAPANGASPELVALTNEVLIGLLAAGGGQVAKKDLPVLAFRSTQLKGNPLTPQVVSLINSDAFLSSAEGIAYDGATVRMA